MKSLDHLMQIEHRDAELDKEIQAAFDARKIRIYYVKARKSHPRAGKPLISVVLWIDETTKKIYRGISICSGQDNPNKAVGRRLAYLRARQAAIDGKPRTWKYLPSPIRELLNSSNHHVERSFVDAISCRQLVYKASEVGHNMWGTGWGPAPLTAYEKKILEVGKKKASGSVLVGEERDPLVAAIQEFQQRAPTEELAEWRAIADAGNDDFAI